MPERPPSVPHSLGRAALSTLLALTLVAAGLLSDAPAWHEYLHPDAAPTHLCVVTFFAQGACEAAAATPPAVVPNQPALLATFTFSKMPLLPRAHFFARLEHAPPSLA